jgi:hypothetical protein
MPASTRLDDVRARIARARQGLTRSPVSVATVSVGAAPLALTVGAAVDDVDVSVDVDASDISVVVEDDVDGDGVALDEHDDLPLSHASAAAAAEAAAMNAFTLVLADKENTAPTSRRHRASTTLSSATVLALSPAACSFAERAKPSPAHLASSVVAPRPVRSPLASLSSSVANVAASTWATSPVSGTSKLRPASAQQHALKSPSWFGGTAQMPSMTTPSPRIYAFARSLPTGAAFYASPLSPHNVDVSVISDLEEAH